MTVFVVQNANSVIMGVFQNKSRAQAIVRLGEERWNEKWNVNTVELNKIEDWVINGNEEYQNKHVCAVCKRKKRKK